MERVPMEGSRHDNARIGNIRANRLCWTLSSWLASFHPSFLSLLWCMFPQHGFRFPSLHSKELLLAANPANRPYLNNNRWFGLLCAVCGTSINSLQFATNLTMFPAQLTTFLTPVFAVAMFPRFGNMSTEQQTVVFRLFLGLFKRNNHIKWKLANQYQMLFAFIHWKYVITFSYRLSIALCWNFFWNNLFQWHYRKFAANISSGHFEIRLANTVCRCGKLSESLSPFVSNLDSLVSESRMNFPLSIFLSEMIAMNSWAYRSFAQMNSVNKNLINALELGICIDISYTRQNGALLTWLFIVLPFRGRRTPNVNLYFFKWF